MFLLLDNLINNLIYLSSFSSSWSRYLCFGIICTSHGSHGGPYFWLNNFGWCALKAGVYGLLRSFSCASAAPGRQLTG
jgi:hypothetical protein